MADPPGTASVAPAANASGRDRDNMLNAALGLQAATKGSRAAVADHSSADSTAREGEQLGQGMAGSAFTALARAS